MAFGRLLIFDFDGVIADSETLACGIAAAFSSDLGVAMSASEGLSLFMGKRVGDVAALIAERGGTVPENFAEQLLDRTLRGFETSLQAVEGVERFLTRYQTVERCIASSSSQVRLATSLRRISLIDWFEGRIFSADDVTRGKPFPDLFLYAAKTMGADPSDAVVIEDSVPGVTAAVAAGMRVVGLLAGSHIRVGHGEQLLAAGATALANTYLDLESWLSAQN